MPPSISNPESGELAEKFVIDSVRCPYCASQLQRYGGNRPLRDVLCSRCDFQAQVKSIQQPARNRIRGAGPRMKGLRDSGGMVPPHFFVWEWDPLANTAAAIDFVPFLPWSVLEFRVLPQTMAREGDRGKVRVEYRGVLGLPRVRVYSRE